nr:MAG TPA: hypothetical protein [Bacteriophage sp.]
MTLPNIRLRCRLNVVSFFYYPSLCYNLPIIV